MSDVFTKLLNEDQKQQAQLKEKIAWKSTQEPTRKVAHVRDNSREILREKSSELPTRDEIQEFSFRLRDQHKVKVQAEVPYEWQDELEGIALKLKVKKMELYRFILGEFLGKVKRKK